MQSIEDACKASRMQLGIFAYCVQASIDEAPLNKAMSVFRQAGERKPEAAVCFDYDDKKRILSSRFFLACFIH